MVNNSLCTYMLAGTMYSMIFYSTSNVSSFNVCLTLWLWFPWVLNIKGTNQFIVVYGLLYKWNVQVCYTKEIFKRYVQCCIKLICNWSIVFLWTLQYAYTTPPVELIVVMTTDVGVGLLKSHLLQIKQLCITTLLFGQFVYNTLVLIIDNI